MKCSLPTILFLLLLTLKLAEIGVVAAWSWWWIAAPIWIPLIVGVAVLVFWGMLACLRG